MVAISCLVYIESEFAQVFHDQTVEVRDFSLFCNIPEIVNVSHDEFEIKFMIWK